MIRGGVNMKDVSFKDLFNTLFNGGLRNFKYKNSHAKVVNYSEETKGSIFVYRNKKNMMDSRGVVITSLEAILENENKFTHFTPNVYRYGSYVDKNRQITKGHSEDNLRQINAFFIDFDVKNQEEMSVGDIIVSSIDLGFMPTFILKSERGYQAFFVLENPVYVTRETDYKSIKAAKIISNNLRSYFSKNLPVDMKCNHFGIARIPRTDNIVYIDLENQYSFREFQDWSYKYSDRKVVNIANRNVDTNHKGVRQIDEPWFNILLETTNIKGEKGLIGRNNVIFTLALAYFSSGVSMKTAKYNLEQFNEFLEKPLNECEVNKIIKSAYSGKYKAAKKEYILTLCNEWCNREFTNAELFNNHKYYKLKKDRSQRTRVHMDEWETDLIKYLKEKISNIYIKTTKKVIREALGIPERTLDKLIIKMEKEGTLIVNRKSGKNGGIRIALVQNIINQLMKICQSKKNKVIFWKELQAEIGLGDWQLAYLKSVVAKSIDKRISYPFIDTG